MIRSAVRTSLTFRLLILAISAGLMFAGVIQLRDAKVDLLPEFGPPMVQIQTEALGLSAAEVEQLITIPLEADLLNGVAWLDEIRSESVPGLSAIDLVFEPGTDVQEARQVVAERLTQAHALPNVSQPPLMLQPLSSTSRVMMIGLSSEELSLIDLSVLARWKIKPRLTGVPGVANVAIWGQRERQLQVQVDPARLQQNGVTLIQVMKTTGNALWVSPLTFVEASTPGSGGFIETPNQRLGVQHISPISTAADLSQVAVEDTEGRRLRLGDVADVVESNQPLIGDAVVDDGPSLMLVVEKFPGASTLEVTEGLEQAFAALAPGLPGVTVDTSLYRPATTVEEALRDLGIVALSGLLLLVLGVGLFLMNWRVAIITGVVVAVSISAAGLVLVLRGTTFNVMTAAGLLVAVGVVIDEVVSVTASIARRVDQQGAGADGRMSGSVVAEAIWEVGRPNAFGAFVMLLAATPMLFLGDLTEAFAGPLMLSYALAVLAAITVGLTLTPVLAVVLFARAAGTPTQPPVVRWLQVRHDRAITSLGSRRIVAYGVLGVAAVGIVFAVPQLGPVALAPPLEERVVLITWDGAAGTSQPEMARITAAVTTELRALSGVGDVGAHIGRAITGDQVVGVSSSDVWVALAPDADYDSSVAAVRAVVDGYPGLFREVRSYPEEQLRLARTGSVADVVVRIYGPDAAVLATKASEVREALARIGSLSPPQITAEPTEPTVEIEVDLDTAELEGIKPGDVRRAAATLVSGVQVGSLFEDQKVFEVVVWGAPAIRNSVDDVADLLIDKPGGGHVRLGDVADLRVVGNPTVIQRDSVSRRVDVTADVPDGEVDAALDEVRTALDKLAFPLEYHAEIIEDDRGDQPHPVSLVITALLGGFLIIQLALGSWRLAGLVLVGLPLALSGAFVAALIDGGPITVAALAGMLTVLGIAVRNVLVLITDYERRRAEPDSGSLMDVVRIGSAERLAPVLLTALVTALVMAPLLVLDGTAGLSVIRPAAVVVLGGLVTSTLLTLVVVPMLYVRLAPARTRETSPPAAEPTTIRGGTP